MKITTPSFFRNSAFLLLLTLCVYPLAAKTGQKQTQLYVDYVKGLYKVLERIRAKYPKVLQAGNEF